MNRTMQVWVLSDGKAGHENQSLGLAEAIARRTGAGIRRVALPHGPVWHRVAAAVSATRDAQRPDLILGAGHATHVPLWWLARRNRAMSVVLMKPSLPLGLFDLCVAPQHDFPEGFHHPKVIVTLGALHRVTPGDEPRSGGLILVGGPSDGGAWDGEGLTEAIGRIVVQGGPWIIGDSRRTPRGWLDQLQGRWPDVRIVPCEETGAGWVADHMRAAREVWVTEDSISMVCEAAGSGARVGLLSMPGIRPRIRHGIDALVASGHATRYGDWAARGCELPDSPAPLLEAERCADELIARLGAR